MASLVRACNVFSCGIAHCISRGRISTDMAADQKHDNYLIGKSVPTANNGFLQCRYRDHLVRSATVQFSVTMSRDSSLSCVGTTVTEILSVGRAKELPKIDRGPDRLPMPALSCHVNDRRRPNQSSDPLPVLRSPCGRHVPAEDSKKRAWFRMAGLGFTSTSFAAVRRFVSVLGSTRCLGGCYYGIHRTGRIQGRSWLLRTVSPGGLPNLGLPVLRVLPLGAGLVALPSLP